MRNLALLLVFYAPLALADAESAYLKGLWLRWVILSQLREGNSKPSDTVCKFESRLGQIISPRQS